MDVVVWLRSLGLGKYEAAFRENDIHETVLPSLTEEHLKQLGVASLGHRVKLLEAIAALSYDGSGKPPSVEPATTSSAPSGRPEDRAERRSQATRRAKLMPGAVAGVADVLTQQCQSESDDTGEQIDNYPSVSIQGWGKSVGFAADQALTPNSRANAGEQHQDETDYNHDRMPDPRNAILILLLDVRRQRREEEGE
jgi:hypothetical protein